MTKDLAEAYEHLCASWERLAGVVQRTDRRGVDAMTQVREAFRLIPELKRIDAEITAAIERIERNPMF